MNPRCTSDGCDLHDYRVASVWCAYQTALETEGRRVRALERLVELREEDASFMVPPAPQPPRRREKPPLPLPPRPSSAQEVPVRWKL